MSKKERRQTRETRETRVTRSWKRKIRLKDFESMLGSLTLKIGEMPLKKGRKGERTEILVTRGKLG